VSRKKQFLKRTATETSTAFVLGLELLTAIPCMARLHVPESPHGSLAMGASTDNVAVRRTELANFVNKVHEGG